MYEAQEPDESDSPVVSVSTLEIPGDIGQTLFEKMKEAQDKRRQKKKERMKVRYRREMAGPGYKRGQKFEPGKKGSNNFGGKGGGSLNSQTPNIIGNLEIKGHNGQSLADCLIKGLKNNKSYMQTNLNNLHAAFSSSEDEGFAQRVVRRKGKQKNYPDSAVNLGQRIQNANKDKSTQGSVGRIKMSKKYSSKEGAIKAKHQPSLGLTCRLVPVGPEKEIVTITASLDKSQQNVINLPHTSRQSELGRKTNSSGQESQGTLQESNASTFIGNISGTCLPTVMDGATNGANVNKKKRKPRPRKGKKGGSKTESQNEGENLSKKNANVD